MHRPRVQRVSFTLSCGSPGTTHVWHPVCPVIKLNSASSCTSGLIQNFFLFHSSSPSFLLNFYLRVTANTAKYSAQRVSSLVPWTTAPRSLQVSFIRPSCAHLRSAGIQPTRTRNFNKRPQAILANTNGSTCLVRVAKKKNSDMPAWSSCSVHYFLPGKKYHEVRTCSVSPNYLQAGRPGTTHHFPRFCAFICKMAVSVAPCVRAVMRTEETYVLT